jgi:UDP-glucose 4-epimerase
MLNGITEKEKDFYKTHLVDRTKIEDLMDMINPKNIIHHRMGTTFEEQVTLE